MAEEVIGSIDGLGKGIKKRKESSVTPEFQLKQWVDSNVTS